MIALLLVLALVGWAVALSEFALAARYAWLLEDACGDVKRLSAECAEKSAAIHRLVAVNEQQARELLSDPVRLCAQVGCPESARTHLGSRFCRVHAPTDEATS